MVSDSFKSNLPFLFYIRLAELKGKVLRQAARFSSGFWLLASVLYNVIIKRPDGVMTGFRSWIRYVRKESGWFP
jgi:hypothetical protein